MTELLRANGPKKAFMVFKGMHEDVDSFGAFSYSQEYAQSRLALRDGFDMASCSPCAPTGCNHTPWTGCLVLKQSAILHAYRSNEDADMNAPPDVLAATEEGKSRRELMALPTALEGKKRK